MSLTSAFHPLQTLDACRTFMAMRPLALVLVSLAACGQRPEEPAKEQRDAVQWKAAYTPAECKALTERDALLERCFGGGQFADENYVGDLKCVPYSPPQRLSGVWVVGFEYSAFFPNASSYEDVKSQTEEIWLRPPFRTPEVAAAMQGAPGTLAYAVELIGRRSLCDFYHGHLGGWPREVIPERILGMRPLPVPER